MSPTPQYDPDNLFGPDTVDLTKEGFQQMVGKPKKYACTVVNLLPREIFEEKHHMLPSSFRIPAAVYGDIAVFYVEEGTHYIPNPLVDEGKPNSSFKTITPPTEMARALVDDYKGAHICLSDNAEPGLFWVEGRLTSDEVKKFYAKEIEEARRKQNNWFRNMVSMADADFVKNKNMLAVSDLQRLAARCLGVAKEWVDFAGEGTMQCPFCTIAISREAVKCPNCREIVNVEKYKTMTEGVTK